MQDYLKDNERLDDLQFNNLFLIQDPKGYCFTSDSVALANYVHCPKGANVVDLCSGSGVVGILVQAKNIVNKVWLVEIQDKLAEMSSRSVALNNLSNKIEIINKPLQNISDDFKDVRVDVVVCNPPYKKEKTSSLKNLSEEIKIARHEEKVTLKEIVKKASELLKFGGKFYTVLKDERLIEIINLCSQNSLEVKRIKILRSLKGANVVLIEAVKNGKSGCVLEFD